MSTAKPMKEVSVDEILQMYNLVVPEIQREYVWGFNQYGIFETFLKDIKEGFESEGELSPQVISLQQTIDNPAVDDVTRKGLIAVLEGLKKPNNTLNIGFLYSYKPSYYISNDREEDLYLIDGQQRFTTLFLILFYFSLKENRKQDFETMFKFDASREKIAFDYRVRSITHQFIIDLIAKSESVSDLLDIRNKQWFLSNYAKDVTVKSIVGINENSGVFNLLNKAFENDSQLYFEFIRKDIKFWHFKTEETTQGEELYITMNSRGQQLADNETIRARLFDNEEVKNNSLSWSEKWEIWQDFFWKNRNKNIEHSTADEGFNEFLKWVQLLKMYEISQCETITNQNLINEFEKVLQSKIGYKLDIKFISLDDIENTFQALKYLYEDFKQELDLKLKPKYTYCTNFELVSHDWLGHENGSLDQISLFQLLPVLLYCVKHIKKDEKIEAQTLLRLIRAIHSLSKDETIGKAIRNQVFNVLTFANSLDCNEDITATLSMSGISKTILNDELRTKLEIYKHAKDRISVEDIFWFAEDLDYNEGEIKHLIDFINLKYESSLGKFDIESCKNFSFTFKELLDNEDLIWGDQLGSQVYVNHWDRVSYSENWYKTNDFLEFTYSRILTNNLDIFDFLILKRKEFISQYNSIEELKSEEIPNKQLYIYYILQNHLLKPTQKWSWEQERWNFGIYTSYKGYSSAFNKPNIYQSIKDQFRENEYRILYVHQKNVAKKISFDELINWSKS